MGVHLGPSPLFSDFLHTPHPSPLTAKPVPKRQRPLQVVPHMLCPPAGAWRRRGLSGVNARLAVLRPQASGGSGRELRAEPAESNTTTTPPTPAAPGPSPTAATLCPQGPPPATPPRTCGMLAPVPQGDPKPQGPKQAGPGDSRQVGWSSGQGPCFTHTQTPATDSQGSRRGSTLPRGGYSQGRG